MTLDCKGLINETPQLDQLSLCLYTIFDLKANTII